MGETKRVYDLREMFNMPIEENYEHGNIIEIEIKRLKPFKNHSFELYEGERLNDMVESIKDNGVMVPIIVRPIIINTGEDRDFNYEILSAHNRVNAAKLAGLTMIPAIEREDLTDEEAMLIVTETNLIQRSFSELSHSEKARILTERHNAIKEQGKRTNIINEIETMSKAGGDCRINIGRRF